MNERYIRNRREGKNICGMDLPGVRRVDLLLPFVSREGYVSRVYYNYMVTNVTCKMFKVFVSRPIIELKYQKIFDSILIKGA